MTNTHVELFATETRAELTRSCQTSNTIKRTCIAILVISGCLTIIGYPLALLATVPATIIGMTALIDYQVKRSYLTGSTSDVEPLVVTAETHQRLFYEEFSKTKVALRDAYQTVAKLSTSHKHDLYANLDVLREELARTAEQFDEHTTSPITIESLATIIEEAKKEVETIAFEENRLHQIAPQQRAFEALERLSTHRTIFEAAYAELAPSTLTHNQNVL